MSMRVPAAIKEEKVSIKETVWIKRGAYRYINLLCFSGLNERFTYAAQEFDMAQKSSIDKVIDKLGKLRLVISDLT